MKKLYYLYILNKVKFLIDFFFGFFFSIKSLSYV